MRNGTHNINYQLATEVFLHTKLNIITIFYATTLALSSDQIFCAQNKKVVFEETTAAFKRINRFSKLISQIKIHEKTDILIYLDDLTKFFNIIFFAFKKNRFT